MTEPKDTKSPETPKSRTLAVYTITYTETNQKGYWNKIGAAWVNKDGSINVQLAALPINGTLHIRAVEEKEIPF